MQTQDLPAQHQEISPAGAEVRLLIQSAQGGMAHCTLKAGKISKAVKHQTVSEFWYVLSGQGAIWRKSELEETITPLQAGRTIDIPLGTAFQYRSDPESDLVFICVTLPPWPGMQEAQPAGPGAWKASSDTAPIYK